MLVLGSCRNAAGPDVADSELLRAVPKGGSTSVLQADAANRYPA